MGKENQAIITYTNWKIVINAPEDMKIVSKCLGRIANCRYIADIAGSDNARHKARRLFAVALNAVVSG